MLQQNNEFYFIALAKGKVKKKSIKLQTSSEQGGGGGGSENYPLCLNPIFDFLNITSKHKLYINMVKFYFCFLLKCLF